MIPKQTWLNGCVTDESVSQFVAQNRSSDRQPWTRKSWMLRDKFPSLKIIQTWPLWHVPLSRLPERNRVLLSYCWCLCGWPSPEPLWPPAMKKHIIKTINTFEKNKERILIWYSTSTDLDTVEVGQPHPGPLLGGAALALLLALNKLHLDGLGGAVRGEQILVKIFYIRHK